MVDSEENREDKNELEPHLLIEASLFTAGEPISLKDISEATNLDESMAKLYLKKLMQSYSRRETSLELIKAGKKYVLRVKEPYVERVTELANPEVPEKVLKTAALIAYHQPIKQSELVEMYGSKVYDHVKELISLKLVRARSEGSTKLLTTTQRFAETFGIGAVSKKKIKGHIRDKVMDKLRRTTLKDYQDEKEEEGGEQESS